MQISIPYKRKRMAPALKLIAKIAVSLLCLYYVYYKVSWQPVQKIIYSVYWGWIFAAIVAFAVSKLISSYRLNEFFKSTGTQLSPKNNLRLYWLGMFYNQFLPGSVSGDAFKVAYLFKREKGKLKWLTWSVLTDRVSGLTALGLITAVIWIIYFREKNYSYLIASGMGLGLVAYYAILRYWLKPFRLIIFKTFFWSIAVQKLQMVCMLCILLALKNTDIAAMLLIFSVACIVSVLPLSIGGIGAREMVFLWGAQWLDLQPAVAVTAGLLFYLVNLVAALPGIYFIFSEPVTEKNE